MSTNLIRPLCRSLRSQCTILASFQESSSKIPQSFTHVRSAHLTPSPSSKPEPKGGRATKIGIVIRSFDDQPLEKNNWGIPPNTSKIGLPESRVLYTVLRSPHIDKKSREQFHMEIKKQYLVIKAQRHELRNKFFWLKRQRIVGAQYELQFTCKTRLDLSKLQSVLHQQEGSQSQGGV